jgi:type I restriction-modification system DNA methylase subunit
METGAAERAACGQRRERVTDWPLMGAAEYKHVVLGPIFLKHVEDAIDERRAVLRDELAADGITSGAAEELLESRDEYAAEGVFWVIPEARWQYLNQRAKQPEIGKLLDNAMDLIDVDNPSLRCMVPRTYARPSLDVRRIGELVDLISSTGGRTSWAVSMSTSSAGAPPRGPRVRHPLVVDLLTIARSRLHEVINDRMESLTDLQTDFADQ